MLDKRIPYKDLIMKWEGNRQCPMPVCRKYGWECRWGLHGLDRGRWFGKSHTFSSLACGTGCKKGAGNWNCPRQRSFADICKSWRGSSLSAYPAMEL